MTSTLTDINNVSCVCLSGLLPRAVVIETLSPSSFGFAMDPKLNLNPNGNILNEIALARVARQIFGRSRFSASPTHWRRHKT